MIKCSDNYSKTSGSLWYYYRDGSNNNIRNSEFCKFRAKITGKIPDDENTKHFEISFPLIVKWILF